MESERELEKAFDHVCERLGYFCLLPNQKKAFGGFLNGRDVFVTLPTGSGKSVCYVALPLLFDSLQHQEGHIVLVVSPLIALMQDQVSVRNISKLYCIINTHLGDLPSIKRAESCLREPE